MHDLGEIGFLGGEKSASHDASYYALHTFQEEITGSKDDVYGGLGNFIQTVQSGKLIVLTATSVSEKILGVIAMTSQGEFGHIDYMGVSRELRGQGIGSQMFRVLEDSLRARGQQSITLTSPFASSCFEIYKKWGFVPSFGRDVGRFVNMTKTLSPALITAKS